MTTPRVTDADVKLILDTILDTTRFITTAHVLVDQRLLNQGLSEEVLTEIELWVAAHFTCLRDPRSRNTKVGDTAESMEVGQPGHGLSSTSYGQQAISLDTTGRLATSGLKQRAGFGVLGHSRERRWW